MSFTNIRIRTVTQVCHLAIYSWKNWNFDLFVCLENLVVVISIATTYDEQNISILKTAVDMCQCLKVTICIVLICYLPSVVNESLWLKKWKKDPRMSVGSRLTFQEEEKNLEIQTRKIKLYCNFVGKAELRHDVNAFRIHMHFQSQLGQTKVHFWNQGKNTTMCIVF